MPSKLEKAGWQTEGCITINQAVANDQYKECLWLLKALLVGNVSADALGTGARVAGANGKTGLWTVVGSSDSVTGAMDGVDRWGSTFDATKLVFAARTAAHSWIVLKSPDALGPVFLTIDYSGASGGGSASADTWLAKVLPTGGSNATRPTSTDEWLPRSQTANNQFMEVVQAIFRCNLLLHPDGSFWFTLSRAGATQWVLSAQKLADTRVDDPYPVVICNAYELRADGTNRGPLGAGVLSPINTTTANARAFKGRSFLVGYPLDEMQTVLFTRSGNNADVTEVSPDANPIDGTFDEAPVLLYNSTSATNTIKGRVPDAYKVGMNAPEGSVAVGADGKFFASVVSDWWLPWTATYLPTL